MAAFGSFIGWDAKPTMGTAVANTSVLPIVKYVERPTYDPLNLSVDLKSGQLTVDGAKNSSVSVLIQQESLMIPKYKIKKVKEIAYVENHQRITRLFNKFVPMPELKLNIPQTIPNKERIVSSIP